MRTAGLFCSGQQTIPWHELLQRFTRTFSPPLRIAFSKYIICLNYFSSPAPHPTIDIQHSFTPACSFTDVPNSYRACIFHLHTYTPLPPPPIDRYHALLNLYTFSVTRRHADLRMATAVYERGSKSCQWSEVSR